MRDVQLAFLALGFASAAFGAEVLIPIAGREKTTLLEAAWVIGKVLSRAGEYWRKSAAHMAGCWQERAQKQQDSTRARPASMSLLDLHIRL